MFNVSFITLLIIIIRMGEPRMMLSSSSRGRRNRRTTYIQQYNRYNELVAVYENLCGKGMYPIEFTSHILNCGDISQFNKDANIRRIQKIEANDGVAKCIMMLVICTFTIFIGICALCS
jgi:hypothetical protein